MTKEQDKAIERCKNLIRKEHSSWIRISNQKAIEKLLNMLKEKDTEIEKYKNLLASNLAKNLNDSIKAKHKADTDLEYLNEGWKLELKKKEEELEMYKELKDIANAKVTDLLKLKQYDDLKKKVDRQDKMIDLMAEALVKVPNNEDNLIIEVINRNLEQKKEEVKQYFERKATNDG